MTRGRERSSTALAVLGSVVLLGAVVGAPGVAATSSWAAASPGSVADTAVTVKVTATAVGFLPRSIEIYEFGHSLLTICQASATCSLDVPVDSHMVVRYEAPVPFSLACPAGSNVDGPGLNGGLWLGWCGTHDVTPIIASADVSVTATATGVVPSKASIDPLPTWTPSNTISFEWDGTDGNWPVTSFDVRYRKAAWNGSFGSYATWKAGTTEEWGRFPASSGSTYCFSVRTNESNGGHSPWTAESCTAVPLDDRSLTRSAHWTAGTGNAYFRSTSLRSTTSGATLTRTQVVAKRIALVATTCSTCGKSPLLDRLGMAADALKCDLHPVREQGGTLLRRCVGVALEVDSDAVRDLIQQERVPPSFECGRGGRLSHSDIRDQVIGALDGRVGAKPRRDAPEQSRLQA